MPWDAQSFQKHNHSLHGEKAGHAAKIANAVLRSSGDEGMAIATANKWAGHHAAGGGIMGYDDGGGIGGITPAQTANPLAASMVQRYQNLPTEKLSELASQMGGTPQGQLIQQLLMRRRVMPQQNPDPAQQQLQQPQQPQMQMQTGMGIAPPQIMQSQASAPYARGGTIKRDMGGGMPSGILNEPERIDARQDSGFLHGDTAGRADQIKTQAPPGAYVLPADVISGLGEGNSLAGARIMQEIINSGPYGTPLPRGARGHSIPRPPSEGEVARSAAGTLFKAGGSIPIFNPKGRAGGGANTGSTPVDLSDGEFVVHPKDVDRFGHGDRERGHRFFDKWVVRKRAEHIKKLKGLPGPVVPRGKTS